ncbi:MAG: hypothetical protein ACTS3F_04725 [Phycisphaerales bacterium]
MPRLLLRVVSFLLAASGFASYIVALVHMHSMDGEMWSDIGNGCMITACFVSLWALHAQRGPRDPGA